MAKSVYGLYIHAESSNEYVPLPSGPYLDYSEACARVEAIADGTHVPIYLILFHQTHTEVALAQR
jgi:hypothetical protein